MTLNIPGVVVFVYHYLPHLVWLGWVKYLIFSAIDFILPILHFMSIFPQIRPVEMWWHTVKHGRGSEWGNWRIEWVASTLHTTSEHGVSSITTADAHTSAASSRLNWRPRRFKWTRPFRRKTKSGFLRVCHHISTGLYSHLSNFSRPVPSINR